MKTYKIPEDINKNRVKGVNKWYTILKMNLLFILVKNVYSL